MLLQHPCKHQASYAYLPNRKNVTILIGANPTTGCMSFEEVQSACAVRGSEVLYRFTGVFEEIQEQALEKS